jgi:hypothetical protein
MSGMKLSLGAAMRARDVSRPGIASEAAALPAPDLSGAGDSQQRTDSPQTSEQPPRPGQRQRPSSAPGRARRRTRGSG